MLILGKKSEYTIHYTCIDVKLKWICIEKPKIWQLISYNEKVFMLALKKKSNFKISLLPKN